MHPPVAIIHKFCKAKYQKRFPELDSLIVGEMEYMHAVKELGNDLDEAKNNEKLQQILTQATIMIVSVTASTTQGTLLTDAEREQINEACNMAIELNAFKATVYEYVESRMTFIAPNLSMIIGASTAAKMLGIAGGLTKLSKMPACNVLVLGAQKRTLSGFSKVQQMPHTGFVYYSQIVQETNPDLRRKAARLLSAKCTLAARVDACHESVHGEIGLRFKEDIEKKLDKLQEPPPVKFAKPLPKPIEGSKKKRGGKRVRKMKERYAMTEFRKQANRLNFGDVSDVSGFGRPFVQCFNLAPFYRFTDRRGRLSGRPGLFARHNRTHRHRAHPAAAGRRENQGAHQQDAAEEPAEATGVRRQHDGAQADLRHGIECGLYAAAGPGDCESAGGRTSDRRECQVLFEYVRVSVGGLRDGQQEGVRE